MHIVFIPSILQKKVNNNVQLTDSVIVNLNMYTVN